MKYYNATHKKQSDTPKSIHTKTE